MKFDCTKITKLRKSKDMTMNKFAMQIGTVMHQIKKYESGATVPSAGTIGRMCSVFGVEPNYFFSDK